MTTVNTVIKYRVSILLLQNSKEKYNYYYHYYSQLSRPLYFYKFHLQLHILASIRVVPVTPMLGSVGPEGTIEPYHLSHSFRKFDRIIQRKRSYVSHIVSLDDWLIKHAD